MSDLIATLPKSDASIGPRAPRTERDSTAREAAEEFEALFLGQMLAQMFADMEPNGLFGGGFAERTYQSLLQQEIGKAIAATSGIGIAGAVHEEILRIQGVTK